MIANASDIPEGSLIRTDVCIVGGGPAGITLARWLEGKSIDTCVLESGGQGVEEDAQRLNEGRSEGTFLPVGTGYERMSRLRTLGGGSGHWGGVFRPLDPLDFDQRPWVPQSGWPISASDLAPYYPAACTLCGVPAFDDEAELSHFEGRLIFPRSTRVATHVFHRNPIHFGKYYEGELKRSPRIRVVLNATATDISTGAGASEVDRIQVASIEGRRFAVKAKAYVLAAGGIENPRLLLLSNRVRPRGLGNDHDQVGRCFMEHPHLPVGRCVIWRPAADIGTFLDFRPDPVTGIQVATALRLSDETLREHRLLNGNFTLVPLLGPFDQTRARHEEFLLAEIAEMHPGISPPKPSAPGFEELFQSYVDQTALFRSVYAVSRELDATRAQPATAPGAASFSGLLYARVEQAPNPESRVTLSNDRDALGQQKIHLQWNLTDLDKTSLLTSVEIIGAELGRLGLGRAQAIVDRLMVWPMAGGGFHHMGTTRMHRDPKQGVADENCRVHGVSNLYVAGSSVFPTCGHANPTLTIVALAVRLADHIAQSF